MINFEEELKKFHPSLEIDQAEEAIYNQDLTDMADLLVNLDVINVAPNCLKKISVQIAVLM